MAAQASSSVLAIGAAAFSRLASVPGGAVLAAAVPLLFLAEDYQPVVTVGGVSGSLSDVAVLAVAAVAAARGGYGALARARGVWATSGLLLAYLFAASLYPLAFDSAYDAPTHVVSAGKFAEYALLAPAAALLLRGVRDLEWLLAAVVGWSVVCTALAIVQYAGVGILHAWAAGGRQPSLLGVHALGAFSAATLAAGLAWLALGERGRPAVAAAALCSGTLGVVLSGAAAAGVAAGLAAVALAAVGRARRTLTRARTATGAAVLALAALGLLAMRSGDIGQFARFAGIAGESAAPSAGEVQTYAQRTLMLDYGYHLWLDRPLLGHGWQSVREPHVFEPQLPRLHEHFPDQPELAFPSRAHPWGIDNAYVQALAELGLLGLAAYAAFLLTPLGRAARPALRGSRDIAVPAALGAAWLLVAAGIWTGQPLVAGASYDALAWLGIGLVVGATGREARERA